MSNPLMVVSTVLIAVGAMKSAQAQSRMYEYNAKVAQQNSQIAEAQGASAVEAQQRESARKMGAAIASFGASGVDVGTGSAVDVLADSARQSTLDTLTTRYNYKLRSLSYDNQANLNTASASNAMQAGRIAATSAVINGASQIAGMVSGMGGGGMGGSGLMSGGGTPIPNMA